MASPFPHRGVGGTSIGSLVPYLELLSANRGTGCPVDRVGLSRGKTQMNFRPIRMGCLFLCLRVGLVKCNKSFDRENVFDRVRVTESGLQLPHHVYGQVPTLAQSGQKCT